MTGIMTQKDVESGLVRSAREGDREAFDELVNRLEHRVAAFVRTRIRTDFRSRLDVDQIVQDTFVRAF